MANIANLSVVLTAKTDPFGKGMRKARRQITEFAGSMVSATASMAKYASGLTIVAAGAAAVFTKKAMATIDATADLSDRLGVATEDLIGLRHAAELAGGGAELLDDSLEKLSKNLGDPSGEVSKSLDKIGLSTIKLFGLNPAEQFKRIADGINSLGSQQEKAAVAADLFGKSGVLLLNVLELGSKGLDENIQRTKDLNIAYSRLDAEKVKIANDALHEMNQAVNGLWTQLSFRVSPLIRDAAVAMTEFATSGAGSTSKMLEGLMGVGIVMAGILDVANLAKAAFWGLGAAALKVASVWKTAQLGIAEGVADMTNWANEKLGISNRLDTGTLDDLRSEIQDLEERSRVGAGMADTYFQSFLNRDTSNAFLDWLAAATDAMAKAAADNLKAQQDKKSADARSGVRRLLGDFGAKSGKGISDILNKATGAHNVMGMFGKAGDYFNGLVERARGMGVKEWLKGGGAMGSNASAVTGTRGTFSGENASRMTSSHSITIQQLQEAKRQSDLLEQIVNGVKGGPVVG